MNRRTILGLFLTAPVGVCATTLGVAEALRRQQRALDIAVLRERVMMRVSDEIHFLETRNYTITDMARYFRLPPHLLQGIETTGGVA